MENNGNNSVPVNPRPNGINQQFAETHFPVFEIRTGRPEEQTIQVSLKCETPPRDTLPDWMDCEFPDRRVTEYSSRYAETSCSWIDDFINQVNAYRPPQEFADAFDVPEIEERLTVGPLHDTGLGFFAFETGDYNYYVEKDVIVSDVAQRGRTKTCDATISPTTSSSGEDTPAADAVGCITRTRSADLLKAGAISATPSKAGRQRLFEPPDNGDIDATTVYCGLLWPLTPWTYRLQNYRSRCTWKAVEDLSVASGVHGPTRKAITRTRFHNYGVSRILSDVVVHASPGTGKSHFTHYVQSLGVKVLDTSDVHNWNLPMVTEDDGTAFFDARDHIIVTNALDYIVQARRPVVILPSKRKFQERYKSKKPGIANKEIDRRYLEIQRIAQNIGARVIHTDCYLSEINWVFRYYLPNDTTPAETAKSITHLRRANYKYARDSDLRRALVELDH